MKLTKKHIQICLDEGFCHASLEMHGGVEVLMANLDEDGYKTMIYEPCGCEPGGWAWMLIGPRGKKLPSLIIEKRGNEFSPVRVFKNVRSAARLAKKGVYRRAC